MDKKIILWFVAGWLLSLIFPPTRLLMMISGKKGQ